MIYIVISKKKNNKGLNSVERVIDTKAKIKSIDELASQPAYADETLNFTIEQLIKVDAWQDIKAFYDIEKSEFVEVEARAVILSKHDFYQRLTMQEQAMLVAPDDIPEIPKSAKPMLKVFANLINIADVIDLDNKQLADGLAELEKQGLLAPGRADEIRGLAEAGDG